MSHHRHLNASPRSPGGEGRGWEASGGAMGAVRGAMVVMEGALITVIKVCSSVFIFWRQLFFYLYKL